MSEKAYKRIADDYLQEYGAQLRRELNQLERSSAGSITPALDRRVRRGTGAGKRARYLRYTGLIAACLVLGVMTPFLLQLSSGGGSSSSPGSQASAPPGSVSSGSAPSTAAPAAPPAAVPATPPPPVYETLPLSFDLPAQFTVAAVEQDIEKTVYHLADDKLDDVVLTLERSGDLSRYDMLVALSIGGQDAFGSSGGGYSLLAFEDEESDILYVLTCKHDINTLLLLGASILA